MLRFKALADETRMRLLHILYHYELSVNELVQILNMGQSRVSRHLKILSEAHLVTFRRDGLWVFYSALGNGPNASFIAAILPHFPPNDQFQNDLMLAERMLDERTRKARQFFNDMAGKWDQLNREILGDFDLTAKVMQTIPPSCSIAADLGCGTGMVLEGMRKVVPQCIGVDGSASMLDLCKGRLAGQPGTEVSLRIGELSHLPLANQEADFACLNLVLHHLSAPASAFSEIRRILKDGSRLFVADFLRHQDEGMRRRYGDHWLGFTREELEYFLNTGGFAIENWETVEVGRQLTLAMIISIAV